MPMKCNNFLSTPGAFVVPPLFSDFFTDDALSCLIGAIDLALIEDGPDLTSAAIFSRTDKLTALLVAKERSLVAGLPIIPLTFGRCAALDPACGALANIIYTIHSPEGEAVEAGSTVAEIYGPARLILKAERVILNFITHLSGIANLTRRYADLLSDTDTRLLDTRKTLPGLRYPEKYAVRIGGGLNHRKNLSEMLMPKDNHIDAAGGIAPAVTALRAEYTPCPPIVVECRTLDEVHQAVEARADRILLDNMEPAMMAEALRIIPQSMETEVSGGVSLETVRAIATLTPRGPDFISVGRLTHSAPAADFSLRIARN